MYTINLLGNIYYYTMCNIQKKINNTFTYTRVATCSYVYLSLTIKGNFSRQINSPFSTFIFQLFVGI